MEKKHLWTPVGCNKSYFWKSDFTEVALLIWGRSLKLQGWANQTNTFSVYKPVCISPSLDHSYVGSNQAPVWVSSINFLQVKGKKKKKNG